MIESSTDVTMDVLALVEAELAMDAATRLHSQEDGGAACRAAMAAAEESRRVVLDHCDTRQVAGQLAAILVTVLDHPDVFPGPAAEWAAMERSRLTAIMLERGQDGPA